MAIKSMESVERSVSLRTMLPIISASALGTAIEWYDFYFYGFLAITVFPTVFFPGLDLPTAILATISTNFAGFVARPLGGAFFGWFGDRTGRKSTLAATLLLMGSATMLMGILPGYASIGIAAPLLLVLLRFLQGVGLGGEWGGSVLLSMEYGDAQRRGFWASWPQAGVPIGLALSALAMLLFKALFPGDAFLRVGWRIPFLQSSILMIVGLYIRLRIMETPAFTRMKQNQLLARAPLYEVLRYHWREVMLCALVRFGETAPFYIFSTFVLTYALQAAHVDANFLYAGLALASLVSLINMPMSGLISDRVGRKRWYAVGAIVMAAFVYPYFLLLQTQIAGLVLIALVFSIGICIPWMYGPEAALLTEQFSPRLRYSGISLGYQLASVTAGGPTTLIAAYVVARFQGVHLGFAASPLSSLLIALYLVCLTVVSLVAVQFLKERAGKAIDLPHNAEFSESRSKDV